MKFESDVARIRSVLKELGIRHLLIGGHAMAAYGRARRTFDVDFAVEASGREALIARMESDGYRTLHRSEGYSNHVHPDPDVGRVDFVYVGGTTAERLFGESRIITLEDGQAVAVPRPEHLAAMKIQAVKNDPSRTFPELADIAFLLQIPGVDRAAIAREFDRQGMRELWNELERPR